MDHKAIIENIIDHNSDRLNEWEPSFIQSVYEWHVLNDKPLSSKQESIIIKINRKLMRY